jgi:hypothetical protein
MELKEILTKVIFDHLEFNNGNVNAKGLIERLYRTLELDEDVVSRIVYQAVIKVNDSDSEKVAKSLQKYRHLIFKREESLG